MKLELKGRGFLRIAFFLLCMTPGAGGAAAGHAQGTREEAAAVPWSNSGHVARCDLTVGRPAFCGAPYTGQAVLLDGGAYHLCDVTLGAARFCAGLYTGQAVVQQPSGDYARCDLTLGRIAFCEGPYTGTAVIPQSAE